MQCLSGRVDSWLHFGPFSRAPLAYAHAGHDYIYTRLFVEGTNDGSSQERGVVPPHWPTGFYVLVYESILSRPLLSAHVQPG